MTDYILFIISIVSFLSLPKTDCLVYIKVTLSKVNVALPDNPTCMNEHGCYLPPDTELHSHPSPILLLQATTKR